nr:MAG TPA: hypothetical protein [Caudoviricetes sp.]
MGFDRDLQPMMRPLSSRTWRPGMRMSSRSGSRAATIAETTRMVSSCFSGRSTTCP